MEESLKLLEHELDMAQQWFDTNEWLDNDAPFIDKQNCLHPSRERTSANSVVEKLPVCDTGLIIKFQTIYCAGTFVAIFSFCSLVALTAPAKGFLK